MKHKTQSGLSSYSDSDALMKMPGAQKQKTTDPNLLKVYLIDNHIKYLKEPMRIGFTNSFPEDPNNVIDISDKFFPEADRWMWNYCTFLGKYTDPEGNKWDLGILIRNDGIEGHWSAACVYGNTDGDYVSGKASMYLDGQDDNRPFINEMIRRAKILNLIK